MKKLGLFITTVVSFIGLGFILASCGGGLPGSKYEKVEFAFKGVEKSFKDRATNSNNQLSVVEPYLGIDNNYSINSLYNDLFYINLNESSFDAIEALYTSSDNKGDVIDELEYDQPPMIQFQYLKSALEKIGTGFEFGTKYYYDIQNTVYYDIDSGEIINDENHKWNYVFRLALQIDIDDNDLITADVSFDITLTQNNTSYNMVWYVGMELDYDMNNDTPNYELNMMTDNKGIKNEYVIENDYVKVTNNKIDEWRKFTFETDRRMIKDNNHSNFDSYLSEGVEYKVDHPKWYKNNNLRKLMNDEGENKKVVARAYFNSGMNSTDINANSFINKIGTVSDKIQEFYSDISTIYGKDIIYSILPDEDDYRKDIQDQVSGILIKLNNNTDFGDGNYIVKNVNFSELLTDQEAWKNYDKSSFISPKLYYIDQNNIALDLVTDLNSLDYYIVINNQETRVEKNDSIVTKYIELNQPESFNIKLKLGNLETVINSVKIDDSIVVVDDTSVYEKEILDSGFVDFRKCTQSNYEITKNGNVYKVTNIEFNNYRDVLLQNQYVIMNSDGYTLGKENGNELFQVRLLNDQSVEFKIIDNPYSQWNDTYVKGLFDNILNISEPKANNARYIFDTDASSIYIYGLTENDKNQYLNGLKTSNNSVLVGGNGIQEVLRIVKEDQNKYYEIKIDEGDYNILMISYDYETINMKKVTYSVNGGTSKEFSNINYGVTNEYSSTYYLYYFDYVVLEDNDLITFTGDGFNISNIGLLNTNYGTVNNNTITISNINKSICKISYYDRYYEMGETEVEVDIIPVKGVDSVSVTLNNNGAAWSNDDITAITTILNNIFGTIQVDDYTSINIDNPVTINGTSETVISCNIICDSHSSSKDLLTRIQNELQPNGYSINV